ncbi:uncharacterized protein LOC127865608 [Dreissena polymorpha]|uniref:Uncharacterized protein n=1 Tax=Dreissena polymorpha TaxID=45954 RepID=A0A9D4LMC2_DREPO|nr:uncharacterized protein LOC127865608 [Dreissena polymorpha]XP_052261436.1 uncharacterized protein LOC127865608 [Dreissena polymorpha]KAH3860187.1 hypothetical protein DPMN_023079 [Dreissena polymorpha]
MPRLPVTSLLQQVRPLVRQIRQAHVAKPGEYWYLPGVKPNWKYAEVWPMLFATGFAVVSTIAYPVYNFYASMMNNDAEWDPPLQLILSPEDKIPIPMDQMGMGPKMQNELPIPDRANRKFFEKWLGIR